MTVRLVKVVPTFINDYYHIYDERGEIDELVEPDTVVTFSKVPVILRALMGTRQCYFKAVRGVEGWDFKSRWKGPRLHW